MDLVAGVRKEGSRGGRGDFKWSDVKDSTHRENYLGHSVMAPVGRWQQGKDLSWYARGDDDPEERARKEREERQRVKDAEEEAMALALGLPPPQKIADSNANLIPLGDKGARDTTANENSAEGPVKSTETLLLQDRGYASPSADRLPDRDSRDSRRRRRERSRSPRKDRERDRAGDRDRDRDRDHKHHRHRDDRDRHHHRSHRSRRYRSRSRSRDRGHHRRRSRSRSRSRNRRDGVEPRRRWDDRMNPGEKDSNHHRH